MTDGGISRRQVLESTSLGFGWMALQSLMAGEAAASRPAPGINTTSRTGSHRRQARSVILLNMVGGPSHMDLFDPKPALQKFHGKTTTGNFETLQTGSETRTLVGTPFTFRKHGECGTEFSSMLPHLAAKADEICLVRSMHSANNNHPQAQRFLQTGKIVPNWPTLGAWISYSLGTENQNMPAFVVLRDPKGYTDGGTNHWNNGWLPAIYRGTEIRSEGDAVLNLKPSREIAPGVRRRNLDLLDALNNRRRRLYPDDTRLESRILNYELAARMQQSADELLDLKGETRATQDLYGLHNPTTADFGRRCLMARRMVEHGVRFVEVMVTVANGSSPFDSHSNLETGLKAICPRVDQPSAALITDLKQRGLLDSTIVVWSGEFGRLPISQNNTGRDHNRHAFSMVLSGGGFRGGHVHGATDEIGYRSVVDPVSVHDYHATVLHQLGVDHHELQFPHNGRDERLTDPEVTGARVVRELLS
tara:strand:- start:201 stop:1628 length:1428 start_codon:yes stop_codon:yes gene_type:complete